MMLSVGGGGKNGDGITVREEEKSNSAGVDGELDWVSEFVQKRAERELVNKLKVGNRNNLNMEYLGTKMY